MIGGGGGEIYILFYEDYWSWFESFRFLTGVWGRDLVYLSL